ncbi:MAG TPA: hypothetical protein VKY73_08835 [Polyangiaceae bacterium]|nr:hypothetical protein [Polyangiaceae bacterium]
MSPDAVDDDALFCALVFAPTAFSRNRFFGLFESAPRKRLRRRAGRVRGIIRQLTNPERRAEILGERVLEDGQVLLRYQVEELGYSRTAALSQLEAATLRYALHRAGKAPLVEADRSLVQTAIARLSKDLDLTIEP